MRSEREMLDLILETARADERIRAVILSGSRANPEAQHDIFRFTHTTIAPWTVIRANDHTYHYRSDQDCRIRTLSPLNLEKDVEFYEIRFQAGGALRSAPHFEGTREFLTVQKGRVRVESAGDAEELSPGDSASYRADVEHAIVNSGRSDAAVFLIVIYR